MSFTITWKSLKDYEIYDGPQEGHVMNLILTCDECSSRHSFIFSRLVNTAKHVARQWQDSHCLCSCEEIDIITGRVVQSD